MDFEWFNFDPIDFHGVKALLKQVLDVDNTLFDISALADLILSQPTIGSTVKVDGKETDPYAMMTAINLQEHREKKVVADLIQYLAEKARTNPALGAIPELLSSGKHVALVIAERLINMPVEIAPPMYGMLVDEIEAAVEDKEPYEFTHYLVLSKIYSEVESTLDIEERKKKKGKTEKVTFYRNVEDEYLAKFASAHGPFEFTKVNEANPDSKRAFQEAGLAGSGHLMLIEASKFPEAVKTIQTTFAPPS